MLNEASNEIWQSGKFKFLEIMTFLLSFQNRRKLRWHICSWRIFSTRFIEFTTFVVKKEQTQHVDCYISLVVLLGVIYTKPDSPHCRSASAVTSSSSSIVTLAGCKLYQLTTLYMMNKIVKLSRSRLILKNIGLLMRVRKKTSAVSSDVDDFSRVHFFPQLQLINPLFRKSGEVLASAVLALRAMRFQLGEFNKLETYVK